MTHTPTVLAWCYQCGHRTWLVAANQHPCPVCGTHRWHDTQTGRPL